MTDKDRYSLRDGLLYGVPLSRPKDVEAWQQRERMIKAQVGFNKGIQAHALEIGRQAQSGQITGEAARAELVKHVSSAIKGFVDEQRQIGVDIARHATISKEGFEGVIEGNRVLTEALEDEIRGQTKSLLAAERRQTGDILEGVRKVQDTLEGQTSIQEEHLDVSREQLAGLASLFDQNERRDFLLAAVNAGIRGIMASSLDQTRLQAALVSQSKRSIQIRETDLELQAEHLGESRYQTELQESLLQESRHQSRLTEDHLLTSQRTNELIEVMAKDLVERLDLANMSLEQISKQIEHLMNGITEGLQKACLVYVEGVKELGREIALTRFMVGKNIEHLTHMTFAGFTAIRERIAETNLLLQEILAAMKSPEETAVNESCRIAVRLIGAKNYKGAIARLEKTTPDSHDFELVHFLLGYAYYQLGEAVAASHYLGWAKINATIKNNPEIAEHAGILLAQMALELEDFSLSMEALESLVTDKSIAPYLRQAHLGSAALNSFSGHNEKAIDSVINQLITNPQSVDQIMSSPFITSLTGAEGLQHWQDELETLIAKPSQFNPDQPHLPYLSLAVFVTAQLKNNSIAVELARISLRLWKLRLQSLTRRHFENEIESISPVYGQSLRDQVLPKLAAEPEFSWLLR